MSKYNSLHIGKDENTADFDVVVSPYDEYEKPNKRKSSLPLSITVALFFIVLICVTSFPDAARSILSRTADTTFEAKASLNSKPNFVFLLADDLGAYSMGYDDEEMEYVTPFMTSLAKKGIIFSNYYTQEVCSPARASLMTGRYPTSVGMQYGDVVAKTNLSLSITETLLPEVLKKSNYINYLLGKWNLGHHTPEYLPTARGFDYFLGFLDDHSYYWSKLDPSSYGMTDLMYSDGECYGRYNGADSITYSTQFYTKKALKAINSHDFDSNPMFLYMSYQAVDDPFEDDHNVLNADYVGEERFNRLMATEQGGKRQQYLMALMLMDDSVREIYSSIESRGQLQNTYFIFASDNGGCTQAGGRNGALRGEKGTLFEGGTKVDAFVYSPLLGVSGSGVVHSGLMHVSDWMPTILSWAGISFEPTRDYPLDGIDQSSAMLTSSEARHLMLYNYYLNVYGFDFSIDFNAPFAIRNSAGFKLMHAYDGYKSGWFGSDALYDSDDNLNEVTFGSQKDAMIGNYTKYLFDLKNDPNEQNNLYDNPSYLSVKNSLYKSLNEVSPKYMPQTMESAFAYPFFKNHDQYIQPFIFTDIDGDGGYPLSSCASSHVFSP